MSGLNDQIELAENNPHWPRMADAEIMLLKNLLPFEGAAFEHIGSTAVPCLIAKPVIDLMIGVQSLNDARASIQPLEGMGYSYWRDNPFNEHFFFVKGLPLSGGSGRTHHVHVVLKESDFWKNQILFRDYLKQNPSEAFAYQRLKVRLAEQFRSDRDGYTNAKTDFVKAVLKKATLWGFDKSNQTL